MAAVKGKNTNPEIAVRKYLHSLGFRYRLHDKGLPGKPDLVLPKRKTAMFIHGCFWHGHAGCKDFRIPKTRPEWWEAKINRNIERDHLNEAKLIADGWHVETIWECQITEENMRTLSDILASR